MKNDNIKHIVEYVGNSDLPKINNVNDIDANRFALAFLMPKTKVMEIINNKKIDWKIEREISETFKVSMPIARYRLKMIRDTERINDDE